MEDFDMENGPWIAKGVAVIKGQHTQRAPGTRTRSEGTAREMEDVQGKWNKANLVKYEDSQGVR